MNPTDLNSLEVFFLIAVMMKATSTVKIQAFIVHSGLFCCFLYACWRLASSMTLLSQLPDRLFSPSDIRKKTVPTLFIAFSNWCGFLWPPRKISGCVSGPLIKRFFHKGSPFEFIYISFLQRGGPLWKKVFSRAKETHPDILCGGHRNQYQLKNAIKSGGTVFCIQHLG